MVIQSTAFWRKVLILALAGGLAFWLANLAISRTAIAAEYRAALSISYVPMLVGALLGGWVVGFCVSYCLVRFNDRMPTSSPMQSSLLLSLIALVVFTTLNEIPGRLLTTASYAWRYTFIGAGFNVVRFSALGIVIGYLVDKVGGGA